MMEDKELRESIAMSNELNVAGEFLYAAIDKINKISTYEEVAGDFYILYHLAVGIERIQKILLVIINDVERDNIKSFLKQIKSHNHVKLHEKIAEKVEISLSEEQNNLLQLLSSFYKSGRYERFNFFQCELKDKKLLIKYILDNCDSLGFDRWTWNNWTSINTIEIRKFLEKTIRGILQKYYKMIRDESEKRNLYCDELPVESEAQKLFGILNSTESSYNCIEEEKRAIKELLLYLIEQPDTNELLAFMNSIPALPLDVTMMKNRITDLCNKHVSQELINEINFMYDCMGERERNEREEKLLLIGDNGVYDWSVDTEA